MESAVLNSLSLVFLVAGGTLWVTSLALARRARRYQASMERLLRLGSQHLEPLELPPAAWPALEDAGWHSLRWAGTWYGQPVHGGLGALGKGTGTTSSTAAVGKEQRFELRSGDEVQLSVYMLHGALRGESRLFASQTAQVFLLLLETRLRERTGALSAALAERARLSLYVQHDMRNMAQWVSWVSADFARANDDASLLSAAKRLKYNAPLALERATRLNAALGKKPMVDAPLVVNLRLALEQAAQLAGLELAVEGEAMAWIAPAALARVLDNLLSNLADNWREGHSNKPEACLQPVAAHGASPAASRIVLRCPLPLAGIQLAAEKLFEPFASGRPGGLGLGLYQARKSVREAGGELLADVHGDWLQFELLVPSQA